ncbi:MAG: hypothetical protein A3F17_09190 [Gammaproteobacteria bacterium RIFCSPHIGHO2_12_FULL_41_15]|nr:MAG: hypothetical protein A3F17_09190 [Gammaproteobacteria bacterium RIFCSPHIGHO2_12_FULL_41_15]
MKLAANQFDAEIKKLFCKGVYHEKIKTISQQLLGRAYKINPLGEDLYDQYDQSPFYRSDVFDCLTFVNTVIALAKADDLAEFAHWMLHINYKKNKPTYLTRHHFMSVDWNPENQRHNIIEDITHDCVQDPQLIKMATAYIDRQNWLQHLSVDNLKVDESVDKKKLLKKLKSMSAKLTNEEASIAYVPCKHIISSKKAYQFLLNQLPSVTIIEMVKPNWDLRSVIGTCLNVSHLGFLLNDGEKLTLRHASKTVGMIVDVELYDYLFSFKSDKSLAGVNIQRLV